MMFKLNNKGWGIGIMFLFIGIFFFAILIIAVISTKYGLTDKTKSNIHNNNQTIIETTNDKYLEYEQIIGRSAADYVNRNYSEVNNQDIMYININQLNIDQEIKQNCNGYVKVGKSNGTNYYNPYIKCNNYQTDGYNEEYNK